MRYAWTHKLQLSGSTAATTLKRFFTFILATFRTVVLPILTFMGGGGKGGKCCLKINV